MYRSAAVLLTCHHDLQDFHIRYLLVVIPEGNRPIGLPRLSRGKRLQKICEERLDLLWMKNNLPNGILRRPL